MKYDVVKEYDWTSIPRGSGLRKRAPRVWVKSYKVKSNEALNRFKSYMQVAAITDAKSFYDKLYGDVASPEDDFNFPFFDNNVISTTNTYGDTFNSAFLTAADSAVQGAAQLYGVATSLVGTDVVSNVASQTMQGDLKGAFNTIKSSMGGSGDPGSYIETPKMYQYGDNSGPLNVSFVLANTINGDFNKNAELVKKLDKITKPFRKNSVGMEPPRIYQVKVPGLRFIKWAYCSSFNVDLVGTKREIGGKIVPEGYQITMSFQSLTTEVSNFIDEL